MSSVFNQYSYVFFSAGAVLAAAVLVRLILRRSLRVTGAVVVALVFVAVAGWLVLRTGPGDVSDLAQAEATIHSGRPTLVEFYSNYCASCMAARATFEEVAAQMQQRFADRFNVLRVDIHSDLGRALREQYGFSYTPEFVVFDHTAAEIWRSHTPPTLPELDRAFQPGPLTNTSS